ncbi:MAG: hypothetical protein GY909_16600 [Oligoflexia bacterium]|nr:hypothetical protein [Oligoflexia bacterium]
MTLKKSLKLFMLSALITSATFAQTTPQPWPGKFLGKITSELGEEWEDVGLSLSTSIFESITDRTLFSEQFGDVRFQAKVKRRVYDNHDILDTWTVIDYFQIPMSLPIPITSEEIGFANGTVGVQLGLNLSLNAVNIRQVKPKAFAKLATIEQLTEQARQAQELSQENEEGAIIIEENDHNAQLDFKSKLKDFIEWDTDNPKTRARYSKLVNLISNPFKIPVTKKKVRKMPIGDISSYFLEGNIQLGASVGWTGIDVPASTITDAKVGLGVSTYLGGKFRVSVLKEKENIAHLKVTKERNRGVTGTLGSAEFKHEIFEGFVVLDQTIFKISDSIVPFNLVVNKERKEQFDIGYRYDLNNEKAMDAYLAATMGRLKKSDLLAQEKDSGVTKAYTRDQVAHTTNRSYRMKLSLVFEKSQGTQRKYTKAKITLGDGDEHRIFYSVNSNFKSYATLWGSSELKRHTFTSVIDKDDFDNTDKGMVLKVEGAIEDSNTNAKEISAYMAEVEFATGQHGLFKPVPKYEPLLKKLCKGAKKRGHGRRDINCQYLKLADYDKTSFFYRIGLTRNQVQKFIDFPEDKMWETLEVAFGVKEDSWQSTGRRTWHAVKNGYATFLNLPLTFFGFHLKKGGELFMARKFFKRWKKLKEEKNPEELSKKLAKLFTSTNHNLSMIKVIREALQGEKISYFLTAKADDLFGRMTKSGGQIDDVDTISYEANSKIEFDAAGSRTKVDPKASIIKFDIDVKDEDNIEITYNLAEKPKNVFIRIDQSPGWSRYKNLLKVITVESSLFERGINTIIINRNEVDGIRKKIADALFNGKYTTAYMAISLEEGKWGAVASKRFKAPDPTPLPGDDDKNEEPASTLEERER